MKIAIVETGLPPHQIGGAELQAWNLAVQLQRRGHEVCVFTKLLPGTTVHEVKEHVRIFRAKSLAKPFGILSYLAGIFFLIRKQRSEIDVVLCFRAWPNGMIGFASQILMHIPGCFSIRGGDWYCVEPKWWGKIIYSLLFNSNMPVLVQSNKIADEIRGKYPSVTSHVIPNGIQLATLKKNTGDSIVYVGNLNPHKGVKVLLEAIRELPDYQVKIVGEGSTRKMLEKEAAGQDVQFFGRVPPERVRELTMKHAKLLVLPTLYSEGFPNALLEAMSLGIPVIATDVAGGVRELLEEGRAGILVPPGDAVALKEAIEKVWLNEQLQEELARSGRTAAEKYSWPNIAAKWERLFDQMLDR